LANRSNYYPRTLRLQSWEVQLHNLDFKLALNIFKRKYNEALKRKDKREILIIHGYGANKLGHIPILATNLRVFLSKNKDNFIEIK